MSVLFQCYPWTEMDLTKVTRVSRTFRDDRIHIKEPDYKSLHYGKAIPPYASLTAGAHA